MPRKVNGIEHFSLAEYQALVAVESRPASGGTERHSRETLKHFLAAEPAERADANKYHAKKTIADGIRFDSKLEARRYEELKLMLHAGAIRWFNRQPSFLLTGGVRYRPDFIVCDAGGCIYVEDAKGKATKEFIIKSKQFRALYPDIDLRIIE